MKKLQPYDQCPRLRLCPSLPRVPIALTEIYRWNSCRENGFLEEDNRIDKWRLIYPVSRRVSPDDDGDFFC